MKVIYFKNKVEDLYDICVKGGLLMEYGMCWNILMINYNIVNVMKWIMIIDENLK